MERLVGQAALHDKGIGGVRSLRYAADDTPFWKHGRHILQTMHYYIQIPIQQLVLQFHRPQALRGIGIGFADLAGQFEKRGGLVRVAFDTVRRNGKREAVMGLEEGGDHVVRLYHCEGGVAAAHSDSSEETLGGTSRWWADGFARVVTHVERHLFDVRQSCLGQFVLL